jgi:hypothetical protein
VCVCVCVCVLEGRGKAIQDSDELVVQGLLSVELSLDRIKS